MKLQSLYVSRSNLAKDREPLRTFCEIAAALGMNRLQLQGHLSASKVEIPKPALTSGAGRKNYYRFSEFRSWWSANQEAMSAGSEVARV
ncbi:hypothetical protein NAV33_07170 [Pseudomonas stutzeri]|uniref:hypothetical protein n=1 Tax=Stutzerimonas stutzeri TaxID=316 RepID=UPI00210944CF|nr:hypothetical protein [Stutzerimonas stutzeri]MCQ4311674.1 hypothetical protein [Stutzerimonas stutzeri]